MPAAMAMMDTASVRFMEPGVYRLATTPVEIAGAEMPEAPTIGSDNHLQILLTGHLTSRGGRSMSGTRPSRADSARWRGRRVATPSRTGDGGLRAAARDRRTWRGGVHRVPPFRSVDASVGAPRRTMRGMKRGVTAA